MYSLIVSVVTACYRKNKNLAQYMYIKGYSFFCSLVARSGGMMMNCRQTEYLWNTRAIISIRTDSLSYVKHVVRCYLKRTGRRLAALPADIFKLQCHTDCHQQIRAEVTFICWKLYEHCMPSQLLQRWTELIDRASWSRSHKNSSTGLRTGWLIL